MDEFRSTRTRSARKVLKAIRELSKSVEDGSLLDAFSRGLQLHCRAIISSKEKFSTIPFYKFPVEQQTSAECTFIDLLYSTRYADSFAKTSWSQREY
jgi:hypothetical protein